MSAAFADDVVDRVDEHLEGCRGRRRTGTAHVDGAVQLTGAVPSSHVEGTDRREDLGLAVDQGGPEIGDGGLVMTGPAAEPEAVACHHRQREVKPGLVSQPLLQCAVGEEPRLVQCGPRTIEVMLGEVGVGGDALDATLREKLVAVEWASGPSASPGHGISPMRTSSGRRRTCRVKPVSAAHSPGVRIVGLIGSPTDSSARSTAA